MSHPPALPEPFRVVHRGTVTSTNDEARALADSGAGPGTLVWADAQHAGRGRRGRTWASPTGNLYVSVILDPPESSAAQGTFVAAVAVADAVADLVGDAEAIRLKWPNDVLLYGGKVAGILAEWTGGAERLIVGIGVNVASVPPDAPDDAACLRGAGLSVTVAGVLQPLGEALLRWWRVWRAEGFIPVRRAWLARAHPVGARLRVSLPTEIIDGAFRDLAEDGTLVVESDDGAVRRISAGDVIMNG